MIIANECIQSSTGVLVIKKPMSWMVEDSLTIQLVNQGSLPSTRVFTFWNGRLQLKSVSILLTAKECSPQVLWGEDRAGVRGYLCNCSCPPQGPTSSQLYCGCFFFLPRVWQSQIIFTHRKSSDTIPVQSSSLEPILTRLMCLKFRFKLQMELVLGYCSTSLLANLSTFVIMIPEMTHDLRV